MQEYFVNFGGMRMIRHLFIFLLLAGQAFAQQLPDGLWNVGRAFSLSSPQAETLILQKQVTMVQLYPGFAVVKNSYAFRHDQADSLNVMFSWTDTASTRHPEFGFIHNLPSAGMTILTGKDTINVPIQRTLAPGQLITFTTYQLCPTSQAKRAFEGGFREHNGLVVTNGSWKKTEVRQVLVDLKGDLRQIDLSGVYPDNVQGNRQRLIWVDSTSHQDLVIWYNGAAPDFKFEKKVLPQQQILFADINDFNTGVFAEESFSPVQRNDFAVNENQPVTSVLYFVLFSIPWIVLLAFIIYLLKKPKKK